MQDSGTSNLLPCGSPPTELKSQATPVLQASTKIREVQIKVEDASVQKSDEQKPSQKIPEQAAPKVPLAKKDEL